MVCGRDGDVERAGIGRDVIYGEEGGVDADKSSFTLLKYLNEYHLEREWYTTGIIYRHCRSHFVLCQAPMIISNCDLLY